MARNWTAYEAAKELYGTNKENIAEIGSRYPLLTRVVCLSNDDYLLDVLKALPKVTARVLETGLKEMDVEEGEPDENRDVEEAPVKKQGKKSSPKKEVEEDDFEDEEEGKYDGMTTRQLYDMCCERGISGKCKDRKKATLIKMLEDYDNGLYDEEEEEKPVKKTAAKKVAKKSPEPEDEDDDWGDDEEDEKDPYAGKSAKELYKMCIDRGIKTKQKLSPDKYVALLKKADEAETESEDEDDDEDWEI